MAVREAGKSMYVKSEMSQWLCPAPAKRDFIPAPFIEHFIPTQMEDKILIWDVCL